MADVVARGIDVSYAQGISDWPKVAKAVDFALIRATATYPHNGKSGIDTRWARNIDCAVAAGVPYGIYHYSYALTVDEVKKEAEHFLSTIKGLKPEYPVAFDFEDERQVGNAKAGIPALPLSLQMDIIDAWMKAAEAAGYYAVLYMSASPMSLLLSAHPDRMRAYDRWVAHVNTDKPMVSGGIWQYSWWGKIDGISGDVDLDYAYQDYPAIIKRAGRNGWGAQRPQDGLDYAALYESVVAERDAIQADYNGLISDLQMLMNKYKG